MCCLNDITDNECDFVSCLRRGDGSYCQITPPVQVNTGKIVEILGKINEKGIKIQKMLSPLHIS